VEQVGNLFVNTSDWKFSNIESKVLENSYCRGSQIFQNPRSHLQILAARSVTCKKFHTQDSQYWSELWAVLLLGGFGLVHVNWYKFLYVRKKFEIMILWIWGTTIQNLVAWETLCLVFKNCPNKMRLIQFIIFL